MRATLSGARASAKCSLQQFGAPTDVLIRVAQQPGGEAAQQAAVAKVRGALGDGVEYRRVEVVGPRVSSELLAYGTIGLVLAIVGILIYLWFRFEWQFALGAMIANVHDIVLTIGFMSLTQIDFDLTSIAALLTILGYSLNDTVVIYDRIREMLRRYKKMPMAGTAQRVDQLDAVALGHHPRHGDAGACWRCCLFGGHAIHSFTATMMFGVVLVGTYTSIFIAAPILIYLGVGTGARRAERAGARQGRKADGARPCRRAASAAARRRSTPTARAASASPACRIAARCCACRAASGPGRWRRPPTSTEAALAPVFAEAGDIESVPDRRRPRSAGSCRTRCAARFASAAIIGRGRCATGTGGARPTTSCWAKAAASAAGLIAVD